MTDYAIVNLLEIDDSVKGRLPGLEGRFSRKYLGSRDLGVSHWRYAPNLRNPGAHSHREQEEAYVVVAGSETGASTAPSRPCTPWSARRGAMQPLESARSDAALEPSGPSRQFGCRPRSAVVGHRQAARRRGRIGR